MLPRAMLALSAQAAIEFAEIDAGILALADQLGQAVFQVELPNAPPSLSPR
jgi:hypothetical protein